MFDRGKLIIFLSRNREQLAAFFLLFLAVCWNFYHVFQFAVNVPFWDEWDYLFAVENPSWSNFMAVHVQHRIFFPSSLSE